MTKFNQRFLNMIFHHKVIKHGTSLSILYLQSIHRDNHGMQRDISHYHVLQRDISDYHGMPSNICHYHRTAKGH